MITPHRAVTKIPRCLLCFKPIKLISHCRMLIWREPGAEDMTAFICDKCAPSFKDRYGIRPGRLEIPQK
jgi:hypothetical protein